MEVRPHDSAGHLVRGLQQVMMVVPVDAQVDEAQHVGQEHRQKWLQHGDFGTVRHSQLQDHDRNNDSEHAVAEGLEPVLFHLYLMLSSRWIPYFSTRLRRVARVMPSSLAAWSWLPLVSLSASITNSRSTAGMIFNFGSRRAHWNNCRARAARSETPFSPVAAWAEKTGLAEAPSPVTSLGRSFNSTTSP